MSLSPEEGKMGICLAVQIKYTTAQLFGTPESLINIEYFDHIW